MNVKDQIKQCPRLTEEQKADALARIDRIENDPLEREACVYDADSGIILFAYWLNTKDGYHYWKIISNAILKI